eukprot:TRINITY_DN1250_c0_g1_i4.p1 TRINITY_DN1250_c0_g1~~TRINITY_DN1250_c0_g1_i4.p1  ORF type:complete len:779 (-),score=261.50 TRINITY_DN1250_c0_g1_i4:20-2356(-)
MVDTIDSHLQDRLASLVDIIMQFMHPDFRENNEKATEGDGVGTANTDDVEVIVDALDQEWDEDDSPDMVRELAYELLVSMAGRTTSDSVRKIMDPMFEYLDSTMSWSNFQFSYECVHALSSSVQSNFAYLTFSLLLDHLVDSEQVPTKIAVARIIGELLTSSGDAIGMAAHHLNDALLQTLHYSLEEQHTLELSEDELTEGEESEFSQQKQLQDEVVSVLRQYAEIQHYSEQKVETAQFILQQMQHHEAVSDSFSPLDNVAYLNCVQAVLKEVDKPLPSGTVVSQALMSPMLRLAQHGVWETRLSVFNILATIISTTIDPFQATSVLKRSNSFKNANSKAAKAAKAAAKSHSRKGKKSNTRRGRKNSKTKNSQGGRFLKTYGMGLHTALLNSALLPDNHPDHFVAIHSVCCCLLTACGPEVLQFTPPMMIRLQKALTQQQQMTSQEGGLDILRTRSAHSMIGAYFVYLADHLDCHEAADYINSVMQERSGNSEHCELLEVSSHGEIDVIDVGYTQEHRDKATYVTKLFKLDALAEALDHSPLVNKHYENRILINEMQAQSFGVQIRSEDAGGLLSAGPSTDYATISMTNMAKSSSTGNLASARTTSAGSSSPMLYPAPLDDARMSLFKPRRRKSTYSSMRSMYDLQQKLAAVEKQHKLNQAGAAHHLRAIFTDNEDHGRPTLQNVNFTSGDFDAMCAKVQEGLEKQEQNMSVIMDVIDQLVQEATEEQNMTNDDEVDLTVTDEDDSDVLLSLSKDSLLKIQFPAFGVSGLKSRRATME